MNSQKCKICGEANDDTGAFCSACLPLVKEETRKNKLSITEKLTPSMLIAIFSFFLIGIAIIFLPYFPELHIKYFFLREISIPTPYNFYTGIAVFLVLSFFTLEMAKTKEICPTRTLWLFLILFPVLLYAKCSFYDTYSARKSEEKQLRKIFNIPESAELKAFNVYPEHIYWQREGLDVYAEYKFNEKSKNKFLSKAIEAGWKKFPVPSDILNRVYTSKLLDLRLIKSVDSDQGYYFCMKAGTNVMYSTSRSQCVPKEDYSDGISGVFLANSNIMKVHVHAGY